MKKSKTVILVDSGCDVPQSLIQKYDMKVLRLRVSYENEHYMDSVALAHDVYKRFPEEIPHTCTPVLQDDYDIIELRRILENNITLDEALSIIFFSKMKSISLIKHKLLYYRSMLKIMRWTTKDKQTKEMLRMTENQLPMLESNLTSTYH